MKRVFLVELTKVTNRSPAWGSDQYRFEVVANDARRAIDKAKAQARRESGWRGGWLVDQLKHRGPAV